jgi:hypothetical protein
MTLRRVLSIAALLTLAICATRTATAQMTVNPLDFSYDYPRIGGDLGFSSVWQNGIYTTGCGRFEEGAKLNPVIGIAYDRPLGSGFRVELFGGYQLRSINSSYNSRENVVLRIKNAPGEFSRPDSFARVDVDFENLGSARFSYLFFMPSVRFNPTRSFFVGAGVSASVLLSASTQYTKNILSKTMFGGELGQLIEISYDTSESDDPYSKVYPEEQRDDAAGFALDGVFYVGAEFPVSKKFDLSPRLLFTYPLTTVFTNPDLKLMSLQFLIGVRYNIY